MLGKLIKHEFKATARTFLPLFGLYFIVSLLFRLFLLGSESDFIAMAILSSVISLVFVVVSGYVSFYPIISSVQRFRKNLLGDEGYLMNTLPVSARKLVISKIIVSSSWFVLNIIGLTVCQIIAFLGDEVSEDNIRGLKDLFVSMKDLFKEDTLLFFLILICAISFVLAFILMIYSSICIGHLSNSGRKLKGFLSFVGLLIVVLIVILQTFQVLEKNIDYEDWTFKQAWYFICSLLIFFNVLFSGIFYFITQRVLTKRLNIQ